VDKIQLVKDFIDSLKSRDGGAAKPRAELLAEEVVFQALAKTPGRDAVLARFTGADSGRVYREATWSRPEPDGDAVKATGRMPPGSPNAGVILTFAFAGDRIAAIKQQPLYGGAPMPATSVKLTDELKKLVDSALSTRHPMILAYVDAGGQPILSFRGSTQSFSDDQFAIWVRNSDGNLLGSIGKNPRVALMYRDEDTKATFQFQGRARVSTDEADRQRVYEKMAEAERNHDYARTGVALIIDLDRVEGWSGMSPDGPVGRVRMLRDGEK
jgi:predicted pyridoxine 5'-phosphate oxidase superfamily flavin-nucleotide-binding protein